MHVIADKHLKEATARFPNAAKQLVAWRSIARDKHWRTPDEVKETFADVEYAADYVVFRIQQNKYRLLATIHYSREAAGRVAEGHLWVRSFLSNKQYEDPANWDKGVIR